MISYGNVLLALRLGVSLLCAALNGIDLSFNVYAVTLKETFNFTQTQVEIVASVGSVGFGLTVLETFLTGVCGYTATFVIIWITLPSTCGLLSLAAVHTVFVHHWPILLYVNQLFLHGACGVSSILISRICLEIIPSRRTGTFLGMYGACVCFGKIIFAGMFDLFFQDDLSGFFLCLLVTIPVPLGLCYGLLQPVAMRMHHKTEIYSDNTVGEDVTSFADIMRSRFFHLTFWTTALFAAAGFTVLNNITFMTNCLGIRRPFVPVATLSVCIMTTRFLYGLIFDKLSSRTGGFVLLFTIYSSFGTGLILGMCCLNSTTVHILTVLTGLGIGPAVHLPLAMFVGQFGRSQYSHMAIALYLAISVCQTTIQATVGFIYDFENSRRGIETCQGADCFHWSFVVLFAVTVLASVVLVINSLQTLYNPSPAYRSISNH